jgi:hypothetical protein
MKKVTLPRVDKSDRTFTQGYFQSLPDNRIKRLSLMLTIAESEIIAPTTLRNCVAKHYRKDNVWHFRIKGKVIILSGEDMSRLSQYIDQVS